MDHTEMLTKIHRKLVSLEREREELKGIEAWISTNVQGDAQADTRSTEVDLADTPLTTADAVRKVMYASNGEPLHVAEIRKQADALRGVPSTARNPYNTINGALKKTEGVVKAGRGKWRLVSLPQSSPLPVFVSDPADLGGSISTLGVGQQ